MRQKITFLFLAVFAVSVIFAAACSGGSTGNQTTTNGANAGRSPMMVTNQSANSPAAVGSNAGNMANAAAHSNGH